MVTCFGMIPVMAAQTLLALVMVLEVQNTLRLLPILAMLLILNLSASVLTRVTLSLRGFMDSITVETVIVRVKPDFFLKFLIADKKKLNWLKRPCDLLIAIKIRIF